MAKLIKSEFNKFIGNRKNRILILLLLCYLVGFIFYYIKLDKDYFSKMEKNMRDQKVEAGRKLEIVFMLERNKENYEKDPEEVEYLVVENNTSTILEYYYKEGDFTDWQRFLVAENRKFNNLISGEEKSGEEKFFYQENILKTRNQHPVQLKREIMKNQYLIENEIKPYTTPYKLNGIQFLVLLLKGYNPMILMIFCIFLSVDIYLKEMEEGSYKLYFTQPYERKKIYWSKLLSILLFIIGIVLALILILFIILSFIYGLGNGSYPQVVGSSRILSSLSSNTKILGEFQIISINKYLVLGYTLFLFMMIMAILSTLALSILINSISIILGLMTSLMMLNYVFNLFLPNGSILRFYLPLSYLSIEQVITGEINASYTLGIVFVFLLSIISIIMSYKKFINRDLLEARS